MGHECSRFVLQGTPLETAAGVRLPMTQRCVCEWCGGQFRPHYTKVATRFCSRRCSGQYFKAERTEAVALWRRQGHEVATPANQREAAE
jgi:hypothetical protein